MIQILHAVEHRTEWHDVLGQLPAPLQDVYFQPEYVALNNVGDGARPVLFLFGKQDLLWAYPFILRPLRRIGDAQIGGNWFDIETAYGYGGPLANSDDCGFLEEAHSVFANWCRDIGVIAEFVRLHPIINNRCWLSPDVDCLLARQTYSIDLEMLRNQMLPFGPKARNMLRRALREGVRTEINNAWSDFELFIDLYERAMDHLRAEAEYFFNSDYFKALYELIQKCGWLMMAKSKEQL